MSSKVLVVIAGPTAVGKTDLTVKLARELGTEVVSADSRQFYKELSIGTAKPTEKEMQGVAHHFINSVSIFDEYNVGIFEAEALEKLAEIFLRKDAAIMTGGSGLFIKAVCDGMDELPEVDKEVRGQLMDELEKSGLQKLTEELKEKDPVYYEIVDLKNPQRVVRALEVIRSTGLPFSSLRTNRKKERPFQVIKIGLTRDRQELYSRIDMRMDMMLEKGLLEEAKKFFPHKELNALQTVGYTEIFEYLEGKYDWEEAVRLLKRNSRRYAKRQMTWFTKDKEFVWFNPSEEQRIKTYLLEKLMEIQKK